MKCKIIVNKLGEEEVNYALKQVQEIGVIKFINTIYTDDIYPTIYVFYQEKEQSNFLVPSSENPV